MSEPCCRHEHVRPCGPVPGAPPDEPVCACGCSGYDERCGGAAWWMGGEFETAMERLGVHGLQPWQLLLMETVLCPFYVGVHVNPSRQGGMRVVYDLTKEVLIEKGKRL